MMNLMGASMTRAYIAAGASLFAVGAVVTNPGAQSLFIAAGDISLGLAVQDPRFFTAAQNTLMTNIPNTSTNSPRISTRISTPPPRLSASRRSIRTTRRPVKIRWVRTRLPSPR